MTEIEIAWLAGLFEGECWFGDLKLGSGTRRTPTISITMTDQDVIEHVAELLGRKVYVARPKPPRQKTYTVRMSGEPAISVMKLVLPYMGKRRREKIEEMLWLYEDVEFRKPYRIAL